MFDKLTTYGETNEGINRIAYSTAEQNALNYLREVAINNQLSVKKDAIGNLFIRRNGLDNSLPIVAMGSHIDSVYNGGKYDGVIGVIAGLEVLLSLNDTSIETQHPIELIIFACEESARFGTATIGSKTMTGNITKKELLKLKDRDDISFAHALEDNGLDIQEIDKAKRKKSEFLCFIELHIEQGPILEQRNIDIGIVTGISAPTRFKVMIIGEASHSGSTPMNFRKDALTGASEITLSLEAIAAREAHHGTVSTVGVANVYPGAMNVIPGQVELLVDIRSINAQSKIRVVNQFTREINEICTRRSLTSEIELLSDEIPTLLDEKLIENTEMICNSLGYNYIKMPSGAGHDAMNMASFCKTGMLFIPSEDGLSHNPKEFTEISEIKKGTKVLRELIIKLAKGSSF